MTTRKTLSLVLAAGVTTGLATAASAAVLSQYTIPNDTTLTPTTEAAGVAASNLTDGGTGTFGGLDRTIGSDSSNLTSSTGVTVQGSAVFANGTSSGAVARKGYPTSFSSPVTASTRYIQFTLAPESGTTISLSSITLDAAKGGTSSTRSFRLGYSTDGFTTATDLGGADFGSTPGAWAFGNFSFDVSAITALQTTSNTVTFRLFGKVPGDNTQIGYDNITINGSVVPEPASLALLGLGGLGLIGRRRNRPQSA